MRLRLMTGWLPTLVAVALALAVGGSARTDVCVVINPVLDIGCRERQGAPVGGEPTSSEPAGASREQQPATRNSTVVRYDPHRVAVTFKPGTARARIRAVISEPPPADSARRDAGCCQDPERVSLSSTLPHRHRRLHDRGSESEAAGWHEVPAPSRGLSACLTEACVRAPGKGARTHGPTRPEERRSAPRGPLRPRLLRTRPSLPRGAT